MTYAYYSLICLALIVFQTSAMTSHYFFDAFIPFIVYIGVFQPGSGSFVFSLFIGLMMDGLSGGAFGVYMVVYLWLYAVVCFLDKIFRLRNGWVLLIILVLGVCFENAIFLVSILLSGRGLRVDWFPIQSVGLQILWTILTGLILIKVFGKLEKFWIQWISNLWTEKTDVLG